MNLNQLAKNIIEENKYLTLATIDEKRNPWVSIMTYAFDEKYNFYFISLPTSKHSIHLKKNSLISFSIFDSRQLFGKGAGLQVEGKAKEINNEELLKVEKIYFGRKYPYGDINNDFVINVKKLLVNNIYRFYKIVITNCWINDPNADIDKRVKINLK